VGADAERGRNFLWPLRASEEQPVDEVVHDIPQGFHQKQVRHLAVSWEAF
jgi:hypothetical protein